jgi:hypothetical protein
VPDAMLLLLLLMAVRRLRLMVVLPSRGSRLLLLIIVNSIAMCLDIFDYTAPRQMPLIKMTREREENERKKVKMESGNEKKVSRFFRERAMTNVKLLAVVLLLLLLL